MSKPEPIHPYLSDWPTPPWDDLSQDRPRWLYGKQNVAFENPWVKVILNEAVAPTGLNCTYACVHFQNLAVGVLPVFDDGTVMLVGQMRYPFDAYSWEMPEGGVPYDEDPLEGAKRELAEEAGLKADHWQEIVRYATSNSVTDEACVIYLATGLSEADSEPDPTEVFIKKRVPFKQLLDAVIRGEVWDGITLAAVFKLYYMAKEGEMSPELAKALLG